MPGLAQRNDQSSNATSSSYSLSCNNGFWSKHGDDVSYNQLQKFWSELSRQARQDLLRIDKQTLFEHARKNMYCSRCNGLLLEVFMQIVTYGKSLQQEVAGGQFSSDKSGVSEDQKSIGSSENLACQEEVKDPSAHIWGGIATTRDGALTLKDCYLYSKSLKVIQMVFDSARARERERELLYPDACGGGGRGWVSQGMVSYGRGHGLRETCALHNARLSCDTLVDFWTALSEDTRFSLLRMKEEDFIERLMYRFDSKRFCRDCRRNVIREFKELKELKRTRRVPRCTTWFCVADTAFQYEVSNTTIRADWNHAFNDSAVKYHYFEWAVGTGEGKSDILDYENVGMKGSVQKKGLDLGGLNACYITLRAWKVDGRCTELSVKAHALKGEPCVHCRLMVGDGYLTISHGESVRRFFEHAEEAEEEEDDNSMDKDDLDEECSRPQKHAKSPELAREFLLDAATVIFKEQVEKAFREGTARQNAHSIFICLALKLLEDRALVACKEIETLEKQVKLLEEEENEKREEERKQRKRTKEREKKLRRKERLREKDKLNKCPESNEASLLPDVSNEEDNLIEETSPDDYNSELQNNGSEEDNIIEEEFQLNLIQQTEFQLNLSGRRSDSGAVAYQSESRYCNDNNSECFSREGNGRNRQSRSSPTKFSFRNPGPRFSPKSTQNIRSRSKIPIHTKKVWEPVTPQKRVPRCSSDSDVTLISSSEATNKKPSVENLEFKNTPFPVESVDDRSCKSSGSPKFSVSCSSSSDNCSSCLSEGDSNTPSSNSPIQESSSTSDSEDGSQLSEERETVNVSVSPTVGPVQQPVPPQIVNVQPQNIHYPFQSPPPLMGYYQQNIHYPYPHPHPNPYLYTPFSYCMPFGTLQQVPVYQPVLHPPSPFQGQKSLSTNETKQEKVPTNIHTEDSGFSLFKFSGPVPRALEDGFLDVLSSDKSSDERVDGDQACSNKETEIEEYKLFAASKGIEFSFF